MASGWSGRPSKRARAALAPLLPCPCWRCGQIITEDMAWHVGHIIDQYDRPDLAHDPSNWAPEHARCNMRAGAQAVNARRSARRGGAKVTSRRWGTASD